MNSNLKVFLSYAEAENQVDWINLFSKHLIITLERLSGKTPVIIDTVSENYEETLSAYILLLNNAYFDIPSKVKELEKIISIFQNQSGNEIKSRFYKVLLEPLDNKKTPPLLADFNDHEFYYNQRPDAHSPAQKIIYTSDNPTYWFKLIDLSYDIFNSLGLSIEQKKQDIGPLRQNIYLAETTSDQINSRDLLKRELQLHGSKVFPDKPLPGELNELKEDIISYLNDSVLSVHILGQEYGKIIPGSDISLIDLQNQLALEVANKKKQGSIKKADEFLPRLVWLPQHITDIDDHHLRFIELLKRDIKLMAGAELIQTPFEEFKAIVLNTIEKIKKPEKKIIQKTEGKNAKIYFIYDKSEVEHANRIIEILNNSGFELITSADAETKGNLVENHRAYLIESDAVLIYYGQENHQWINIKLKDLMKCPGYGKVKPFIVKGLITKQEFNLTNDIFIKDFVIINKDGDEPGDSLMPFLNKLKK